MSEASPILKRADDLLEINMYKGFAIPSPEQGAPGAVDDLMIWHAIYISWDLIIFWTNQAGDVISSSICI
jgi:hypothetical protein